MDATYLHKAVVGVAGMSIGAALVTLIHVAGVAGVENARLRHFADIASGHAPTPRVVLRGALDCPNMADTEAARID